MTRKVLHLIPTLRAGGAEQQLVSLSRHLPAEGWDVAIGYGHAGVHLDAAVRTGAHVERLKALSNYDPLLALRVRQLIRRTQPAIVQTWLPQMDVVGGFMARVADLPWVVAERSTVPLEGRPVAAFVRDRIMKGATAVVSNNERALERWAQYQPSVQRFHIPNALSLADIDAVGSSARVASLRGTGDRKVMIGVGRLIDMKRFDVLIEALKRVSDVMPAVGLLCGDGPHRPVLEARAQSAGVTDRLLFAGFVSDVAADIKSSDVLIALSEYEGRPNVVLEAMAARTPLIVSDIPEHREILDSDSALFVAGDDPDEVAAAVLDVFRNREAANARAARARQTAEQWNAPRIAAQYAAVYDQIVSAK